MISEPSRELKPETPEEEDPLPLEFLQSFEDDLFEDFRNTSNFLYQKRPPVLVTPMDPSEEDYIRETIRELIALIINEWLQEGESFLKPILLESPCSSFRCRMQDHDVDALFNPTIGANLMSDEFALAFFGNRALTPIDRKLKRPSRSLVNSYGVLRNMSFWHGDVKFYLNFHVFEDLDFDFLIGHPIKALLEDAPKSGCLNIDIGKESLLVTII